MIRPATGGIFLGNSGCSFSSLYLYIKVKISLNKDKSYYNKRLDCTLATTQPMGVFTTSQWLHCLALRCRSRSVAGATVIQILKNILVWFHDNVPINIV